MINPGALSHLASLFQLVELCDETLCMLNGNVSSVIPEEDDVTLQVKNEHSRSGHRLSRRVKDP